MSAKTTTLLALVAGFAGGIASQRIMPVTAYAQSPTLAPAEIRAQKFIVVDENGKPRGAFGIDNKGNWATLEVTDSKGTIMWGRFAGLFFSKSRSILPSQ